MIQPNGDLCLCWNQVGVDEEAFGSIIKENSFRAENYYKWRLHDPFEIDECRECQFLPLCMGGCPAMRVIPTSDFMYRKGEGRCSELRYNLKDMLEYVYKTSKAEREKNKKKEMDKIPI